MTDHKIIIEAVARIIGMEFVYDVLTALTEHAPDALAHPSVLAIRDELADYYGGGTWLSDFTLDERGELSHALKRGVLSEDGVYDLLSEIDSLTAEN